MIRSTSTRNWTVAGLTAVLLFGTGVAPAVARQDPGTPAATTPSVSVLSYRNCPLTRIGTQFVRCDNLTGAGVSAPSFVPEG
jgi:hypothetical protein